VANGTTCSGLTVDECHAAVCLSGICSAEAILDCLTTATSTTGGPIAIEAKAPSSGHVSTGVIVGAVLGTLAALAVALAAALWLRGRMKSKKPVDPPVPSTDDQAGGSSMNPVYKGNIESGVNPLYA